MAPTAGTEAGRDGWRCPRRSGPTPRPRGSLLRQPHRGVAASTPTVAPRSPSCTGGSDGGSSPRQARVLREVRGGERSTSTSSGTRAKPTGSPGDGRARRPAEACSSGCASSSGPRQAPGTEPTTPASWPAYLAHRDLARHELPAERFFMGVALLRVLFAHSLVATPRLALGALAPASRMFGDPRLHMADLFLSLHGILPARYPLHGTVIEEPHSEREPPRAHARLRRHRPAAPSALPALG
jgi:hypothetical protein